MRKVEMVPSEQGHKFKVMKCGLYPLPHDVWWQVLVLPIRSSHMNLLGEQDWEIIVSKQVSLFSSEPSHFQDEASSFLFPPLFILSPTSKTCCRSAGIRRMRDGGKDRYSLMRWLSIRAFANITLRMEPTKLKFRRSDMTNVVVCSLGISAITESFIIGKR